MKCAPGGGVWNPTELAWETRREFGQHPEHLMDGPTVYHGDRTARLPDFGKQVKLGARLLDEEMPGWWRHINTSSLDLKDEEHCVLGQTWEHYQDGKAALTQKTGRSRFSKFMAKVFSVDPEKENRELAAKFGFDISGKHGRLLNYQIGWRNGSWLWATAWEHLTKTWLKEIAKRQRKDEKCKQLTG